MLTVGGGQLHAQKVVPDLTLADVTAIAKRNDCFAAVFYVLVLQQ